MKLMAIVLCGLFFVGCKKGAVQEKHIVKKEPKVATKQSFLAEEVANGGDSQLDITNPAAMGWKSVTVDPSGNTGSYNSLDHGMDGGLAIAYFDAAKGDLKCAMYKVDDGEVSWDVALVDSLGDVGLNPSLDHDSAGNPAISYYDWTNRNLKYAAYREGSWVIETVDEGGDVGQFSSLQHDSEGRPTISYYDRSNADLKYAAHNGSRWVRSVVDSAGKVGQYNCLRHSPEGYPVISYYDFGDGKLKCALYIEDEWRVVTVDDGSVPGTQDNKADVGRKGSLIHGVGGKPAISYFDNTNGKLKYAVYEAPLENFKYYESNNPDGNVGEDWHVETIEGIENIGQVSSLSRGVDGQLAISCREYKEERLLYLTRSENGWKKEPVFAAGLVGEVTSLSHAPNGRPAIACYSATDEKLRLLSWTIIPKEETE